MIIQQTGSKAATYTGSPSQPGRRAGLMPGTPTPASLTREAPLEMLTPPCARRRLSGRHWLEFVALLAIGIVVMRFIQLSPDAGADPGLPGHDSFYHTKMATMIPEHGLLKTFPWLHYAWFTESGDGFVSHHYGFHMLLLPFISIAEHFHEDSMTGGRWAIAAMFGISLALFHLILAGEGVRWRWLWLIAFVLMPAQFFGRHGFVRAISPSLAMMLLITFFMFRRRYWLMALSIAAYSHLYLGAVLYAPVIVGAYWVAGLFGPREDRRVDGKLLAFAISGWVLGIATCPYLEGMLDFLKLQVLGTGLSPDISVGQEWQPYTDVWWFAKMVGPVLCCWAAATLVRLRTGPPLGAKALSMLIVGMLFLVLTLKARRFIEYFPAFALLSAALIASPLIDRVATWFARTDRRDRWRTIMVAGVLVSAIVLAKTSHWDVDRFAVEWPMWTFVAALYLLVPLSRAWGVIDSAKNEAGSSVWGRMFVSVLGGVAFVAAAALMFVFVFPSDGEVVRQLPVPLVAWFALFATYGVVAALVSRRVLSTCQRTEGSAVDSLRETGDDSPRTPMGGLVYRGGRVVLGGLGVLAIICLVGARPLADRQADVGCQYDLPKIRAAMTFLKEHSEPGDVVFTDDWDIFPVYFYYNTHNHYIVGLDPKFTHHREPDLWNRYVQITRGQTPATIDSEERFVSGEGEPDRPEKLRVRLEDIRTHFGARFVVTDRDHKSLAMKLAAAPGLATLIYPAGRYADCRNAPYLIFEISNGKPEALEKVERDPDLPVYLGMLTPTHAKQGWGDLSIDHSVGGGPIQLGDRMYLRGIGTHAPSEIEYVIPKGFNRFEAVVGVDASTLGEGSISITVLVDGESVFHEALLTGATAPVRVSLSFSDATTLTLVASSTDDGQRFDHVDWAMARFIQMLDTE